MSDLKNNQEKIKRIGKWKDSIYNKYSQIAGSVSLCGLCLGIFFWLFEALLHTIFWGVKPYLWEIPFSLLPSYFLKVFFPAYFWENISPSPHEFWMRATASGLIYILGFVSQYLINKGRKTEKELRLTNEKLNKIFQTAADGMRLVNTDFKVLDVNDTFLKLLDIEKEDAIGKNCHEVFWGDRCQTNECPMVKIKGGAERCIDEVVKTAPNGIEIPCIVTATAYSRGTNGELIEIVEDFKDMRWYHEKNTGESKKQE